MGIANLNGETPPDYLLERPKSRTVMTPNVGKGVEQQERSLTAGGDAKRCSHFAGQCGGFLQN